jgi:hypothetical protein
MLPSLNVRELTNIIREAKASAPPQAFKAVTDICEARVDPARWKEVRQIIGLSS